MSSVKVQINRKAAQLASFRKAWYRKNGLTMPKAIEQPKPIITPDYSAMLVPELRKECEANNIVWRNTRGKGKHMLKAQMVAALENL